MQTVSKFMQCVNHVKGKSNLIISHYPSPLVIILPTVLRDGLWTSLRGSKNHMRDIAI